MSDAVLPSDKEIEEIALRLHAARGKCVEAVQGCQAGYRPSSVRPYSITDVDPFTHKKGSTSQHQTKVPAEFTIIGDGKRIVLSWSDGDDAPPKWHRYEDKVRR
jgi:hypothetical protein